ncbi:MAG: hypothetical protein WBV36_09620, partial [Terriglobales bacterium]
ISRAWSSLSSLSPASLTLGIRADRVASVLMVASLSLGRDSLNRVRALSIVAFSRKTFQPESAADLLAVKMRAAFRT